MPSKFGFKSAQKSSILSSKAGYARSLFFILSFTSLQADNPPDNLYLVGQQAQAFASIDEIDQAQSLYEPWLEQPLPEWQKATLLYNLATLQLQKQQFEPAQQLFQQIPKQAIGSPWLMRDLSINSAINLLLLSLSQAASKSIDDSPDLLFQVHASQHLLKQAEALHCLTHRLEKVGFPLEPCPPSPMILLPLKAGERILNQLKLRLMEELAHNERTAIAILLQSLPTLIELWGSPELVKQERDYLLYQTATLNPVWEQIKNPTLQGLKKDFLTYQGPDRGSQLKAILDALKKLTTPHPLDLIELNTKLLLYNDVLTHSNLHFLLEAYQQIKPDSDQKELFTQATQLIHKSLLAIDAHQQAKAHLYLAASLSILENLNPLNKQLDPVDTLSTALSTARLALHLSSLYDTVPPEEKSQELGSILKSSQHQVTESISPFVAATLRQQQTNFKATPSKCQKSPWDQAIPLYDQGARAAYQAEEQMQSTISSLDQILAAQAQTVVSWKAVLKMLKTLPSEQEQPTNNQPQPLKQHPSSPEETLRLLQEMQLEDQPNQWHMPQEFKSW